MEVLPLSSVLLSVLELLSALTAVDVEGVAVAASVAVGVSVGTDVGVDVVAGASVAAGAAASVAAGGLLLLPRGWQW